ncbi:MAG: hypothetical protein EA397_03700 [Deltaproteobacteria bacterium]|nr:MAG: hypothetical protein EA397_03700 [Deltaproteobacteria bacterium]
MSEGGCELKVLEEALREVERRAAGLPSIKQSWLRGHDGAPEPRRAIGCSPPALAATWRRQEAMSHTLLATEAPSAGG